MYVTIFENYMEKGKYRSIDIPSPHLLYATCTITPVDLTPSVTAVPFSQVFVPSSD
jgi:hypothetical protein